MGKRLNDTAKIVDRPPGHGSRHTISCRQIENGYVTEVSESNPTTGRYSCREVFSKNAPDIQPPKLKGDRGRKALGEAVDYLKSEPSGLGR